MSRVRRDRSVRAIPPLARAGAVLVAALAGVHLGCNELPPGEDGVASGHEDRVAGARGLVLDSERAEGGCTLFSPLLSTTTYLIDRRGRVVHTWVSERAPGASVELLDNGHLLRCAREREHPIVQAGGEGGRIEEMSWDGELVWDYVLASRERVQHHDIEPLPGGNVLAIVWEHRSRDEAICAGRRPDRVPERGLYPDGVVEIEPLPPAGGRVVWEWHAWDHLVQDLDPAQANFGVVSDHPELIDINGDEAARSLTGEVVERLKALGYVIGSPSADSLESDLLHTNAIAYHPELDQILLSVNRFDEIWILDHSTTSSEAAGHSGGRAGRGGDLIYRWGNPRSYGRGSAGRQQLFAHHDGRWIPEGFPGAGNITIFNNGAGRPGGDVSSVVEITPPLASDGSYALERGSAWGPDRAHWSYPPPGAKTFSADFLSSAQRLANGNTFICSGPSGRFFEVTPEGDIVWEYQNPFAGHAPNPAGDPPYSVFRATRIPADHPALVGRPLVREQGRDSGRLADLEP